MEAFITAIAPSLCVSLIMLYFNHKQAKRAAREKTRETLLIESENVKLQLILASAKLSYATAMAVKTGHPNGEIDEGIRQYRSAMADFKTYERSLVVEHSVS